MILRKLNIRIMPRFSRLSAQRIDWNKYPNFRKEEFDCSHTGKNEMKPELLETLQEIRIAYNHPIIISSGFRDTTHPVEAKKDKPGAHSYGVACDITIRGEKALELMQIAMYYGIRRIGVNQKGRSKFIHLDIADRKYDFPKTIWSY